MDVSRRWWERRADHEGEADANDCSARTAESMGVVASPDGKYIYYAMRKGPFSYNAMFPQWSIMRRDRKTGDEDTLIEQLDSASSAAFAGWDKNFVCDAV